MHRDRLLHASLFATTALVYVATLPVFYDAMGPSAASVIVIVPTAAGFLYGVRGGVIAALVAAPLGSAYLALVQGVPWSFRPGDLYYLGLEVGLGFLVGRFRDMQVEVRAEVRERKAVEVALRESEAIWRSIFEQAPEHITVLDPDGTIRRTNARAETAARIVGRNALDLLPAEERDAQRAIFASIVEKRERVAFESQGFDENGDLRTYWTSAGPVLKDDRVTGILSVASDVTERKRQEKALRQSEKLSSLGTLVAGVAHEINNPLAYMQGNVELAKLAVEEMSARPDLPTEVRADLAEVSAQHATALRGIEKIANITRSLRRIARAPSGERGPVDANGLVETVLDVARARFGEAADVRTDLAARQLLHANEGEVSQVLLNLLFNASDAVKASRAPRVEVRTRDDGAFVVIDVVDNGPGIPLAQQPNVFTPFHTTKKDGTGLGLSVSHRIAEDHGGTLTFESAPGAGATFTLRLPAARPE